MSSSAVGNSPIKKGLSGSALVAVISVVAALGGLLFGYDTGIIGVALLGLKSEFTMSSSTQEIVTGAIIFGALVGCFGTGPISDKIGRRITTFLVGVVFAVGSVMSALAPSIGFLIFARLVLGLAAGSATQIIPVYIAEVTPPEHRGKMVVMFQFMVVFGISFAYFWGYILGDQWRIMFALGVVPAIILMLGIILLPESPRWLLSKGRLPAAEKVLLRVRKSREEAQSELKEIETVANRPQGSWKDLTKPWLRPAIIVAAGMAMFSQITGNNAIIYYAPTILTDAGFGDKAAILATGGGSILMIITTLLGSWMVDKVGRRRYLLTMIPGSIIALIIMGAVFMSGAGHFSSTQQILIVLCLVLYLAFNVGSFGVCLWLIISEVFPLFIRGKGASLGAFSHWTFDLLVSMTTLSMINAIGLSYAMWLYAAISFVAMLFVLFLVPETNGRSLEEIENALRDHRFYPFKEKESV